MSWRQYGFRSPAQAANVLITAKRMFARFVRAVIAEYMEEDGNVETEITELKRILAQPHPESPEELRKS